MLSRWFGPSLSLKVTIAGQAGGRMLHWRGMVRVRAPATVRDALSAAGRAAGADLLDALAEGAQPVIMLNGIRVELPAGLERPITTNDEIAWLLPMAGGS